MDQTQVVNAALKAGAAKFYPEHQSKVNREENYVVSQGFLQRFAEEILKANET